MSGTKSVIISKSSISFRFFNYLNERFNIDFDLTLATNRQNYLRIIWYIMKMTMLEVVARLAGLIIIATLYLILHLAITLLVTDSSLWTQMIMLSTSLVAIVGYLWYKKQQSVMIEFKD